ncbi:MAG: serine acetyltransferase [Oscillospiraceae bacterium]|nr:serine acetyltransferase [Oscillospiraceae bacterium]MBR2081161.1 serine acetyltransferase [Oscillospiraceae bacterium]
MTLNNWLDRDLPAITAALNERHQNFMQEERTLGTAGRERVIQLINLLRSALFPGVYENAPIDEERTDILIGTKLREAAMTISALVHQVLFSECTRAEKESCSGCQGRADYVAQVLLSKLPEIREKLDLDIRAAYEGDPAVRNREEILLSYPFIEAITIHRIAHVLYELKIPVIPRIMSEYAHQRTGIDIHPGASIGKSFFIDHGTGVVIGETCTIGDRVKMYQGVTLGARSFTLDEDGNPVKGIKRHPDIEDDVVIYAGATILGGDTRVGRGSVIGGNVWLIKSVAPYSKVVNSPELSPVVKEGRML